MRYHISIGRIVSGVDARWAACDPVTPPPWMDDLDHACQLYVDLLSALRSLSREEKFVVYTIDLLRVAVPGDDTHRASKSIYRRTLQGGIDVDRATCPVPVFSDYIA